MPANLRGCLEQEFYIAPKMSQAINGNRRFLLGFGENKGPLNHGLCIKPKTFHAPGSVRSVDLLGCLDVTNNQGRMSADVFVAGLTNDGVRIVSLLNHGAQQAGKLRDLPLDNIASEVDIAQQSVQRVGGLIISCLRKEFIGHGGKMFGDGNRQLLFAFEVMKEAAFGDTRRLADVIHGGGRIAFGADNSHRRIQELAPGFCASLGLGLHCCLFLNLLYQPVGMYDRRIENPCQEGGIKLLWRALGGNMSRFASCMSLDIEPLHEQGEG